jgi:hypothetical protein
VLLILGMLLAAWLQISERSRLSGCKSSHGQSSH